MASCCMREVGIHPMYACVLSSLLLFHALSLVRSMSRRVSGACCCDAESRRDARSRFWTLRRSAMSRGERRRDDHRETCAMDDRRDAIISAPLGGPPLLTPLLAHGEMLELPGGLPVQGAPSTAYVCSGMSLFSSNVVRRCLDRLGYVTHNCNVRD